MLIEHSSDDNFDLIRKNEIVMGEVWRQHSDDADDENYDHNDDHYEDDDDFHLIWNGKIVKGEMGRRHCWLSL